MPSLVLIKNCEAWPRRSPSFASTSIKGAFAVLKNLRPFDPDSDWQSTLDWIYSLANWETRPPGTKLSFELDRIRDVLTALGNPQEQWPAVHVAGTNGKGSTCAMIAQIASAAGYRCGFYSSPHLHCMRERIQIDGELVSEERIIEWLRAHRQLLESFDGLTTFEALTAMAFAIFAEESLDLAVIEVGLGGRLDTTNLVQPLLSIITPIGLDHQAVLGDTLAKIALDKAGIMRSGVPVIMAPQKKEARAVVQAEAEGLGAPLVEIDQRFESKILDRRPEGIRVALRRKMKASDEKIVDLPLIGDHQAENALLAYSACSMLVELGLDAIDERSIEQGLRQVRWPARLEWLANRISPKGPHLLVDGAHNPPAARSLVQGLEQYFDPGPRVWILGASRGKDLRAILAEIGPTIARDKVYAVRAAHPRAMPPEELAKQLEAAGLRVEISKGVPEAIEHALREFESDAQSDQHQESKAAGLIVATGSLFVAADARMHWARMGNFEVPAHDPPV